MKSPITLIFITILFVSTQSKDCPACQFISPPFFNTNIGQTTACSCTLTSAKPYKVTLEGTSKFCCASTCPMCNSFTTTACSTCPPSSAAIVATGPGPTGNYCCRFIQATTPPTDRIKLEKL